ncbi:group III truncated hemoglobin [Arenibacter certesii]|uniref:Preprotein translocase subunit TatC n=1 Tax=Arenibacter certesii TaxID=228955 RepID=A0A918MG25_9FLAO|nr:group III truncated hemoglobin [Arenibacter certesii]GGW22229.1 preprotein translocase subunit TatC [Arenibacter certesii]
MKQHLRHRTDIHRLVETFYSKIKEDPMLAPIFNEVIKEDWEVHIKKMYSFWGTVLLNKRTYYGNPFMPHADLPVEKIHFDRWLLLFNETRNENFEGEKAEEAKWRAQKMAEMFHHKIRLYRTTKNRPLI